MTKRYPFLIVLQYKNSGGPGSETELIWRQQHEVDLTHLLTDQQLGYCYTAHSISGWMEIFMRVINIERAVEAIIDDLTDRELIGWARIASSLDNGKRWKIHYPDNGAQDIFATLLDNPFGSDND